MSNFKLQKDGFTSYTCVANAFIENYMPKAAGEFVKIYIYLLKCVEENRSELSISRIADAFENTQKDVVRALKYWEKKGLLELAFEGDLLTSLKVVPLPDVNEDKPAAKEMPEKAAISVAPARFTKPQYTKEQIAEFLESDELAELVYIIEKYLNRKLTGSDLNSVLFFYDVLKLPLDVIEYLFEYCVTKDKTTMRYIETTAIAWSEKKIASAEEAKAINVLYSEKEYPVMKAFGIAGRRPTKKEASYIQKWTLSYGFDTGIIIEACERTLNTIHQPSFEYTDSILKNWHSNQAFTIEEIEALDQKHADKTAAKKAPAAEQKHTAIKNEFINYAQRDYDYSQMESILLSR